MFLKTVSRATLLLMCIFTLLSSKTALAGVSTGVFSTTQGSNTNKATKVILDRFKECDPKKSNATNNAALMKALGQDYPNPKDTKRSSNSVSQNKNLLLKRGWLKKARETLSS